MSSQEQNFDPRIPNVCQSELTVWGKEIKYCYYTVMFLKDTILFGINSPAWIKSSCPIAEQEPSLKRCKQWHITDCYENPLRPTVWRHTCSRLWNGETMRWAQWTGGSFQFLHHDFCAKNVAIVLAGGQTSLHLRVDLFDAFHRLSLSSSRRAPRCT